MKKILLTILLLTASTLIYSQGMDLNHKKIHIVDSTMGLGISPTSRLHVFGNGTASNLFNVTNDKDATKDSSVVIDAVGNVGIGKTPTSRLEVVDGLNTYGGSVPLAIARTMTNNKIAFIGSAVTNFSETFPAYNIGLYGTAMGGTNNFAGYFGNGNVYVQEKVGIGTEAPTSRLHVEGSDNCDNIYSEYSGSYEKAAIEGRALGSDGYGIKGLAGTIGAKAGSFENYAQGTSLEVIANNGIAINVKSGYVIADSTRFISRSTTLSDNEQYAFPPNLSWKGEIDVDSLGYTLFTAQIRCDANSTPYLEGVSWKRWKSITYVQVGSLDGYLNIIGTGSNCMVITNTLGYTIKATLRFRTKQ